MTIVTAELYSDINKKTPLQKSRIINVDSIKNSVSNILNINSKDLLFDFSNIDLESYLFEAYTEQNASSLELSIYEKLQKEPRIDVDFQKMKAIPDPANETYTVNVPYDIKGINVSQVTSFKV